MSFKLCKGQKCKKIQMPYKNDGLVVWIQFTFADIQKAEMFIHVNGNGNG